MYKIITMLAGFPELFILTNPSNKNHHRDISIGDNSLNIQYHNSTILNVLIIIINYQGFDI